MWSYPGGSAQSNRAPIYLGGELDVGSAPPYLGLIRQRVRDADRPVEVDLAAVTSIDVTGLQALLHAERDARRSGREVRYQRPSDAVVRLVRLVVLPQVRRATGLDAVCP